MLKIQELNFGFNDAENYKRRENKNLFNQVFCRTEALDDLCERSKFFLIGEKGTGKTAYAVFLANNKYKGTNASLKYIRETDYQKFISLKKEKHLVLSDYSNIWKVILYLLLGEIVYASNKSVFSKLTKLNNIKKAVDEYYANAFSPEIVNAFSFVEESRLAAELMFKYAKAGGESTSSVSFTESRFQTNLAFIQRQFEDAFSSIKLTDSQILFIDGIDIRPSNIPYSDYLECVKGLANAVWSINNDFFPSIRDTQGRLRVVLMVRPDIFDSLGLQNQNTKIRDNAVLLDWRTAYSTYKTSNIFEMTDKLLSSQQETELKIGEAWDHYFPYKIPGAIAADSSFINFLRFSFYRPRDMVTMLSILQEIAIEHNKGEAEHFTKEDFDSPTFRRRYSSYLLGEIKDHLSFYYSSSDYESFLEFFKYLDGKIRFNYDEFIDAYTKLIDFLKSNSMGIPKFFESSDKFLQFLYELNVISYIEGADQENFIRWCFRERTYSNISPKVKTHLKYAMHYGLSKSLNMGQHITKRT